MPHIHDVDDIHGSLEHVLAELDAVRQSLCPDTGGHGAISDQNMFLMVDHAHKEVERARNKIIDNDTAYRVRLRACGG